MSNLTKQEKAEFFDACDNGDVTCVEGTLSRHPEALRLQGTDGWTPLMRATGAAQTETVALLLEYGADADAPSSAGYSASNLAERLNYASISDMFRAAATTRAQREEAAAYAAAIGQFTKGLEQPLAVPRKPLKLKK